MRRKWTKEEERYLLERYLNQPTETTAKSLGRTVVSVKRKASKLGLNHYLDNINAKAVAKCFNCDVSVIIRWIKELDLPTKEIKCNNQTRYSIDPNDFWKWAENHKAIINWSRYERDSLPPDPEWVADAIKNHTAYKSRKRFGDFEKAHIKSLLRKGHTCKEVAEMTGRSLYSIRHVSRNAYK